MEAELDNERNGMLASFVAGRIEITHVIFPSVHEDEEDEEEDIGFQRKKAVQFWQLTRDEDDEDHENILTFFISTDQEKLALAEWIIQEKLGDFCNDNAMVYITELHISVTGQAIMVPIAEQVASP